MVETVEINLCRICLENGATIPLFENCENENCDLQTKLVLCLKEKIEDVEGYPRCICQRCSNIIDETYNLIKKYEDTCRILENGLDIVKKENEDFRCNEEAENEVDNIKYEYVSNDDESRDDVDDDFRTKDNIDTNKNVSEPFKTSIKLKTQVSKKNKYNKKVKQKLITSKIASSILEGEFSWSGEKWCLNTSPTNQTIKELPKLQRIKTEKKRYRIKIPKTKHPNPPKLCDLCGKVFNNQDKLNGHKRRIHFKQPVKCTMCSKILGSNYYLERHMKRAHSGEKNFVCELCDRRFAFKGELTTHNRNVHNKHLRPHKQFKCKYCNKIYKCSKSVTIHERSTHTGQRPAACTVCDSSFYHEDYLKEHMRLHTGETPFKCPICGRGYAQRGNMKSHLRIHRRSELDAATLNKIRPNYLKLLKA